MTIYLYFIFLFLNLIFAYRKKSSKLLTICTLVFIFLLIGGAGASYVGQNDYINYRISYDRVGVGDYFGNAEVGYVTLMKIGNFLQLDFFIFRLLITALCLFIIYYFIIKRYANNYNYVLLIYMIYPMTIDSEQFRNFIGLTILLFAIRFLENNSFKNKVKYIALVLIASSIHAGFFLYLVLLLVNTNNKNRLAKGIAIVTIVLCIIAFLNNNEIPFLNLFLSFLENEKVVRYLTTQTNYGFLIPFSLHTINFIMIFWARRIIILSEKKSTLNNMIYSENDCSVKTLRKDKKISDLMFINMIYWINIIGIVFFPLYMMSITLYRLSRNFLILNLIVYSIASGRFSNRNVTKFLFNLNVIISVIIWLIMDLYIKTSPERVLIPFFTKNIFFN